MNMLLLSKICTVVFGTSLVFICIAGCNSTSIDKPVGKPLSSKQLSTIVGIWIDPNGDEIRIELDGNGDLVIGKLEFEHDTHKFAVFSTVLVIRNLNKTNVAFVKNPSGEDFFFGKIGEWDGGNLTIQPSTDDVFREAVNGRALPGKTIGEITDKQRVVISADEAALEAFFSSRGLESCFSKDKQLKLRRR